VSSQRHAPAPLPRRKRSGIHCRGGRVGPRARLEGCGKSRSHRDLIHGTSSPVATRFTDYAIPDHILCEFLVLNCIRKGKSPWNVTAVRKAETFSAVLLLRPSLRVQVRVICRFKRLFLLNRFHWNADRICSPKKLRLITRLEKKRGKRLPVFRRRNCS